MLASTTAKQGSISSVAIGGRHIAYTVATSGSHGFGAESLHVRGLSTSSRARSVYTATSGGANMAVLTTIGLWTGTTDQFVVARTNQGSGKGDRLLRYDAVKRRFSARRATRTPRASPPRPPACSPCATTSTTTTA